MSEWDGLKLGSKFPHVLWSFIGFGFLFVYSGAIRDLILAQERLGTLAAQLDKFDA